MSFGTSSRAKSDQGDGFDAIYPGASQKVAFDGSVASTALSGMTSIVEVSSTQDCHLAFGAAPVAAADGTCMFLPKGVVRRVGVQPNSKIAAIKDSAGGNLFITEGA